MKATVDLTASKLIDRIGVGSGHSDIASWRPELASQSRIVLSSPADMNVEDPTGHKSVIALEDDRLS